MTALSICSAFLDDSANEGIDLGQNSNRKITIISDFVQSDEGVADSLRLV
jgi:hypothetical protein